MKQYIIKIINQKTKEFIGYFNLDTVDYRNFKFSKQEAIIRDFRPLKNNSMIFTEEEYNDGTILSYINELKVYNNYIKDKCEKDCCFTPWNYQIIQFSGG